MILIADSGSTKADWVALSGDGVEVFRTQTAGLNPDVLPQEELKKRLAENSTLAKAFSRVEAVNFYGAGCGTARPRQLLHNALQELLPRADISIREDTVAAALATAGDRPGIICILGTGSNCSYYDGKAIRQDVESLGHAVMDDASGMYFGRELIRDFYFKKMPEALMKKFESRFDLDADTIKYHLYKQPHPNSYLASFAPFLFENTREEYIKSLLKEGIVIFTESHIFNYREILKNTPVYFVGSIAHFAAKQIWEVAVENGFTPGGIVRRPIDGLIAFYSKKIT